VDHPPQGVGMAFTSKRLLFARVRPVDPHITSHPSGLRVDTCTHRSHTTTTSAMAHFIDVNAANFEVHFLHSGHPRHGLCVMSMNPVVYYEFQTPVGFLSTHTIVTDASGATLAIFDWFGPSALGTITWRESLREAHMCELVMPTRAMPE